MTNSRGELGLQREFQYFCLAHSHTHFSPPLLRDSEPGLKIVTYTPSYTHTHTRTRTLTHTHTHTHTHTQYILYAHTCVHILSDNMHVCWHTHKRTQTHIHTHTHTHTHTKTNKGATVSVQDRFHASLILSYLYHTVTPPLPHRQIPKK